MEEVLQSMRKTGPATPETRYGGRAMEGMVHRGACHALWQDRQLSPTQLANCNRVMVLLFGRALRMN